MNWKTIFIVGLGILSIVALYYCYKRYYNEEGFQLEVRKISSETFENPSAALQRYTFDGSIITVREIYSEIVTFLTDYRNFSGYADANSYTYYSNKYKKNLTIADFSYPVRGRYWFPYTGQYGASPNWLTNFSNETTARIDLDIYNYNLNRYIGFIKSYSGSNKQKFLFNRSLAKPSLVYSNIDVTLPPTSYNLTNATGIIDTNITKVAEFNQNYQSWFTNFTSYAKVDKNIYPKSDLKGDTEYRVFYSGNANNDKPPNLTYSNINSSKQAGQIVNLIPDRKNDIKNINEQLELNVYGGGLTSQQIDSFKDCMFLGSVFANFDDQYNLDTILRVPYNGIVNGSNCYYSFNMFTPDFEYTLVTPKVYEYRPNENNITYNTNLINLRSGNTIKMLNDSDLAVTSNQFITNVNTIFSSSRPFTPIANSNEAYVGQITREMMAKIPNLARRYITSWVHNRSRKYLTYLSDTITGSVNLNKNELKKAQYISLAIKNFGGEKLTNFLNTYAGYGSYTNSPGQFNTDATILNVPNEEAAKRIVASSRIYNSYLYDSGTKTVSLSKNTTGGNVFNSMSGTTIIRNEFRNANPTKTITSDVITTLSILINNIGAALVTFPTDGLERAKTIIDLINETKTSSFRDLFNKAYTSVNYVKTILNGTIRTLCGNISESLNKNSINDAMIQIKELVKITQVTSSSEYSIHRISGNGTYVSITNTLINSITSTPIYVGDYISISGTSSYDGRFLKIVETTSNPTYTLKIRSQTNTTVFPSVISSQNPNEHYATNFKIRLDSLHRCLIEAQSDTNTVRTSIDNISVSGTTITQIEKDNILKNININKKFIDSFVTNYDKINTIINSIYRGNDINQMINNIIVNTSTIQIWNNTTSYKINDYVRIDTRIFECIRDNKDISPPNTTYWKEFIIPIWNSTTSYDINDYVKIGTRVYKCIQINIDKSPTVAENSTFWKELTDANIRIDISGTNTTMGSAESDITTFLTNLTTIKNDATNGDTTYSNLVTVRNTYTVGTVEYDQQVNRINTYLNDLPQYKNADSIISYFSTTKESLISTKEAVLNLNTTIGETGPIADAMAAPTNQEIQALKSDFENLIHNNKLLPNYDALSNLNISDPVFLNSIAQLYYESSDGLYEMTAIYDVFMIGSNSVDIRFDKKQRLPKGRINNLNILYLPEIQEYNRLLDIMDDGSWSNYPRYRDYKYILNGQTLTSNAIDFYYDDLSAATNRLDPIFNPIYPVDQTINVKDLQIELKNLNTSNNLITRILTGKLKRGEAPFIPETPETVGYNYTDRLLTIQYGIQDRIYKIETQISGILQSCARVFVTPINSGGKWKFTINGMAIGINAALTYNLAYNGNLEVDMANTQGNIGQYYPTIIYTKNSTPPIICGDIKFINKAVAIFNQTAFLNLSSLITRITGDDITKRQASDGATAATEAIDARSNNFYDSNDGPLYVDKILGFQQVNSNTCHYRWQETQYDPLTNGIFTALTGNENLRVKRRTKNVQIQFMYDNLEYQNPRLIPDNNPGDVRPNEGFKYLPDNSNILFGDLYLSLYNWYASATRDLYNYLNEINNKYTTLYTPQYTTLVTNYNTQTSNISTLNHSTMALFSTNLLIAKDFRTISRNITILNSFDDITDKQVAGTCDSISIKPPIFTNNYDTITYNYRPGNGEGLTTLHNERTIQAEVNAIDSSQFWRDGTGESSHIRYFDSNAYNNEVQRIRQGRRTYGTYNKYRTVDIKDFFNSILNQTYRHSITKCDNAQIDPENCFTVEDDGCKYTYSDINSDVYSRILLNINKRDSIKQGINNTNALMETTSNNIKTLITEQTRTLLGNNIVQGKGRDFEDIYPEISNINTQITSLLNNSTITANSIEKITQTYYTLLTTQTSDTNLPIYMANQVIPITKPLPEESYSLENHYGQCPAYSCTSPVVMNSLIEQYNLDNDYDDTITSILKGATPNPYQCDYLVEVRKKNAIITNTNMEFDRIRFRPVKPLYSDNKEAIYFPGNNHIQLSSSCLNIDSNNFTIDWFQYIVLDDENPNPFIFSYGENDEYGNLRCISVQFITDNNNKSIIEFTLYINGVIFINNIDFNFNQLNRWTYFAIVRNNNVITCYKDGFAFVSKEISVSIINSSIIYIGSDGSRIVSECFKGAICNFSFNNYDALYTNNFFNTVPSHTTPVKNINTKFIIDIKNNIVDNIISRNISIQNTNTMPSSSDSITQTYLTNGTILKELFRGNNQNNGIAIDPSNRIFIADTANHVIKVRGNDGKYTTIVGTGRPGSDSSDELLKTRLYSPSGLCFGNTLYIADTGNNRICYIRSDNTLQVLITEATNISHIAYYSPYVYYLVGNTIGRKNVIDSPFINTQNYITISPSTLSGISFDNAGNLYIADSQLNRIYRVLSGSTTYTTIISTGLNKPLSVTADSSRNLYIANSGDEDSKVYMALYNSSSDTYNLNHIAGNGSRLDSFSEGYAKIIPLTPRRVLYHNDTLYIVDSRRICFIEKANIPNIPNNSVFGYYFNNSFNNSSIRVGSNQEADYKFNKNLFTIQWFMYMEDSSQHTIFTFENNTNYIHLGVTFDNNASTTRMNLYINNQETRIEFNKREIVGLWVHMGIVNNGSTLSIYKNSILVHSLDSRSLSFNSSGSQLTVGNRFNTSMAAGFKGQLLSFMIYNKVAKNYNSIIEPYITQSLRCIPNLVLHLASGTNTITDSSIPTLTIYSNSIMKIDSYPYSTNYNNFSIRLYYSDNTTQDFNYTQGTYGTKLEEYGYIDENPTDSRSLGARKRIRGFRIYSQTYERAVQQWLLEGWNTERSKWDSLHKQLTPYISRSSPIYPKANTYSEEFRVVPQANIGGDIVKMTKSFQVATLIEDCSYVITSNIDSIGNYTKGVSSFNAYFIQDNTPYVSNTPGSTVPGFQYIGNLLGDYESNIESVYDPVISNSSTISGKMSDVYNKSKSDTYGAVGKLNTLNFYSSKFNNYSSLRTYMENNVRFRNTIFDGYSDNNSYMSNIIRFSIVDSDKIDIVFNKVDLTGLTLANIATGTTYNFATRTTTAGARYSLSVSQGFLDLSANFLSNVTPFANIFNDDFTTLTNSRRMDYKDRLNYREKLLAGVRNPITVATASTLPTDIATIQRLTGLTNLTQININESIQTAINKVEYMLDNENGTLPISKTNFIVQYISNNEVNSVIPATLDNTSFKIDIPGAFSLNDLISAFKTHFNSVYRADATTNAYPYNSVMKKVYKSSIVNKILYVSCSVEYTTLDSSETTIKINYNKTPNIEPFKTEVYYRVVFKSVSKLVGTVQTNVPEVIAFEPCLPTAGGSLTNYSDSDRLLIEGATSRTDIEIRNNYITNLLFTEITFIPKSLSYTTSYSITQIELFKNSTPIRIDSISINGGITDNYNLTMLIDGVNPKLKQLNTITERIFTHTYDGGEISAKFNRGTNIDGFSFMTGSVENNPQGWTVKGTADGTVWIELIKQDTVYNTPQYLSFYRTPIFSFISAAATTITEQPNIVSVSDTVSKSYRFLRIRNAKSSKSSRFQLTNITLYDNKNLVTVNTATDFTDPNRNFLYLFRPSNLNSLDSVITYESDNNTTLNIQLTALVTSTAINFNGISFVSGIDVDKCMDTWIVEGSLNRTSWEEIVKQDFPYVNEKINFPHFFCRTPIFYYYRSSTELSQPALYDIKNWPIRHVRFTPIYMYGETSSTEFEVSHFEFFKDGIRLESLNSSVNMNLITPYINTNTTPDNPETTINDLTIFRGRYQVDTINFQFSSDQSFNGFSFMSGPDINKCIQLWRLEVSTNGTFWVTAHFTPDNKPYSNENYPSSYYRLPHMAFFKNISIESNTQYYIVSGTPTEPNNNGSMFKIRLLYSYVSSIPIIKFTTIIDGRIAQGIISIADTYDISLKAINWSGFYNSPINPTGETLYRKNEDFQTYNTIAGIPTRFYASSNLLYQVKQNFTYEPYYALLDLSPVRLANVLPNPIINGQNAVSGGILFITPFFLYRDTITSSGRVNDNSIGFDTIFVFYLDQLSSWVRPVRRQGFTNYISIDYMNKFLVETNRPLNSDFFRLIGPNKKVIDKKFYTVELNNKVIMINLIANIEIIGYTITTGLYSHLSDANSWKVYGMKKNKWILLDKQDNYDIPVERSYTLPPFFFNSKNNLTLKDNSVPNVKIIEDYYKKKINPFGKAVFKQYMFDNNKTYYMVFDEYDNNRNLIDTDLIIGFVMGKGVVKKPIMYENPDGSFDAFNLKKKEMMSFWKKKIGLKLETKYLSDY